MSLSIWLNIGLNPLFLGDYNVCHTIIVINELVLFVSGQHMMELVSYAHMIMIR